MREQFEHFLVNLQLVEVFLRLLCQVLKPIHLEALASLSQWEREHYTNEPNLLITYSTLWNFRSLASTIPS